MCLNKSLLQWTYIMGYLLIREIDENKIHIKNTNNIFH